MTIADAVQLFRCTQERIRQDFAINFRHEAELFTFAIYAGLINARRSLSLSRSLSRLVTSIEIMKEGEPTTVFSTSHLRTPTEYKRVLYKFNVDLPSHNAVEKPSKLCSRASRRWARDKRGEVAEEANK